MQSYSIFLRKPHFTEKNIRPLSTNAKLHSVSFVNFRDFLKLLCKGICYVLSLARSGLRLAFKISTPMGSILKPNLASMCITPFDGT